MTRAASLSPRPAPRQSGFWAVRRQSLRPLRTGYRL